MALATTPLISDGKELVVDKIMPINDNVVFAAAQSIRVINGGGYNIAAGKTLTIKGSFDAGLFQVFFGSGSVAFTGGSLQRVYPEWWGAKADNQLSSASVNRAAFDAALLAARDDEKNAPYRPFGTVIMAPGTYYVDNSASPLRVPYRKMLEGVGWYGEANTGASTIRASNDSQPLLEIGGEWFSGYNGLRRACVYGGSVGVRLMATAHALLDQVDIQGATVKGLQLGDCQFSTFRQVRATHNLLGLSIESYNNRPSNVNTFDEVYVGDNQGNGIEIRSGSGNVYSACTSERNGGVGLYIDYGIFPAVIPHPMTDLYQGNNGPNKFDSIYLEDNQGHQVHIKDGSHLVFSAAKITLNANVTAPGIYPVYIESGRHVRLNGYISNRKYADATPSEKTIFIGSASYDVNVDMPMQGYDVDPVDDNGVNTVYPPHIIIPSGRPGVLYTRNPFFNTPGTGGSGSSDVFASWGENADGNLFVDTDDLAFPREVSASSARFTLTAGAGQPFVYQFTPDAVPAGTKLYAHLVYRCKNTQLFKDTYVSVDILDEAEQNRWNLRTGDFQPLAVTDGSIRLPGARTIQHIAIPFTTKALEKILLKVWGLKQTAALGQEAHLYAAFISDRPGFATWSSWGAAPTIGTWDQGSMVFNSNPTAGGAVGWICTAAGSPGTWKEFGTIAV